MIDKKIFYSNNEHPHRNAKGRMWNAIESETQPHRHIFSLIPDRRSFYFGVAATVLLYFASIGAYSTVHQIMVRSEPADIRLDAAYRSAIGELEEVVPQAVEQIKSTPNMPSLKDYVDGRMAQLADIDKAILALRAEIHDGDLSPLKQQRLRGLYTMKLQVLQEMIEKGDIQL
jgi:hypothetical protein